MFVLINIFLISWIVNVFEIVFGIFEIVFVIMHGRPAYIGYGYKIDTKSVLFSLSLFQFARVSSLTNQLLLSRQIKVLKREERPISVERSHKRQVPARLMNRI